MSTRLQRTWTATVGSLLVLVGLAPTAAAQESKSAPLAKELSQLLDARKLDSVAAKDPATPDAFVGALYFPGSLLVVSARYSVPVLLTEKLNKKDYKEIYIDLNSASIAESKTFVEDVGADGLRAKREENQPFDSFEKTGKRTTFDSDWKKQKLSEDEYMKVFSDADDAYAKILMMLLAEIKKVS